MTWILVIALIVVGGLGALLVIAVAAGLMLKTRAPDPAALLAEGLEKLDYAKRDERTWTRPMQGTLLEFSERPDGLRWHVRLPRYNTMTLQIEEAQGGRTVGNPFKAGVSDLDARFSLGSPQPDRLVTLLKVPKVQKAVLKVPHLSLELSADELIIQDPGRAGVKSMTELSPVDAELYVHSAVINLINALFGSLYAESGTVLDQFR